MNKIINLRLYDSDGELSITDAGCGCCSEYVDSCMVGGEIRSLTPGLPPAAQLREVAGWLLGVAERLEREPR